MTTEITAVIDSVIRLQRSTLGPDLIYDLTEELTRENPAYHSMLRMKQRNPRRFQFAKMPDKVIQSIFIDDHTVYIPRGAKSMLLEKINKHNCEIRFIDERVVHEYDPGMSMIEGFELLAHQKSNLANPIIKQEGIIEMPCGGGKTVMGIAIAMTIKQPTLILVHTHDLLGQWLGELQSKAVIPGGIGVVGAGKRNPMQVTIATIQTLTRMGHDTLVAFLDNFGCVILDECHHCPAATFLGIMNLCKAKHRYGLTATVKRKDSMEFLMHDTIGPIVALVTDNDLGKTGRSQTVGIKEVITNFNTHYTADDWAKLIAQLVSDEDRNNKIAQNIVQSWNDGHFPLILSDRVGHCRVLANLLEAKGMNVEVMTGSVLKHIRKDIIQRSKDGLVDAIVATKVADEGLDIPNLSCLHITCPTANEAKLKQRVGRIRRVVEGKTSVLYDYVDSRVTSCLNMYKKRRKLYRDWGFDYLK